MIAAIDRINALGANGKLPWPHLPTDGKRFRSMTLGHTVVMGRKTYESIGHALDARRNIILSRTDQTIPDAEVFSDVQDILELSKTEEIWIIGGAEIYTLFLPYADVLHITVVDTVAVHADAFFPDFAKDWKVVSESAPVHDASATYRFQELHLK